MKRWRCDACAKRGQNEEWEDHRTASFCHACGEEGSRIVEFGCFTCDDEGVRFFDVPAPSHPCPKCGSDCYRIIEAPMLSSTSKKGDYEAADKMLEAELQNQRVSTTSLKREPRRNVDERLMPHWTSPNQVLPPGGRGVGGRLPFGMPRPQTVIAGKDSRPAKVN